MSAAGIIFANVHDNYIPELTASRTIGSVPFACRYRFIDFALSNMANSDITNINIITNINYLSLMDHIGSGKDWDLARRNGGIKILPPNVSSQSYNSQAADSTRLEALKSVTYLISRITDEYVVLSDCDVICNIDLRELIKYHEKSGADITLAAQKMELTVEAAQRSIIVKADEEGVLKDILTYPNHFKGEAEVCLNILVMRTEYLKKLVTDSIAHNYTSLTRDIILRRLRQIRGNSKFCVYRFDGPFAAITSLEDYYKYSMRLLSKNGVRQALFEEKNRPILTKIRNSTPTYYSEKSVVKNSLIADGCVIEGTVENSILFRGVRVGRNSVVKNTILMQDSICGENVSLNCVVTDKNVVVRDGVALAGIAEQPFYIAKGKML